MHNDDSGVRSGRGYLRGALGLALAALPSLVGCGDGDGCFVGATRIATPRGPCRIDELAVGDAVWSWDLERGIAVERPVARIVRAPRTSLLALRAGDLTIPGVTPNHPFFEVRAERFVPVGDLSLASHLLAWSGDGAPRVRAVDRLERVVVAGAVDVFDLTIEGPDQNFFAEGLLVHNKPPRRDAGVVVDASVAEDAAEPPEGGGTAP